MVVKDFALALQSFSANKQVVVVMAHMDPFYYDTSDVEANTVSIVVDDEGMPWEICETDDLNNVVKKVEVLEG
jgi:uncharacterized radical SAM superfamily Fe-S cluster-containing enzyme